MFIVEMYRERTIERPDPDVFDCPWALWTALGHLAVAFGWEPTGVVVELVHKPFDSGRPWEETFKPGTWGGPIPGIEGKDAEAWRQALERGSREMDVHDIDLPHEGPFVINSFQHGALNQVANHGLTRNFIRSFIAYLERGSFRFAWDD